MPEKQVTLTISASQAKVFALALRRADMAICNQGCGDFDLDKLVPDLAERQAFMKAYHQWNGDPEEYEADVGRGDQFRWWDSGAAFGLFMGMFLDAMEAAGVEDKSQNMD